MDSDRGSNPSAAGDRATGYATPRDGMPGDAVAQPSRRRLLYGAGAGLGLAALAPVLDMTSAAPGTGGGFLMIAELQARSGGVKLG